MNVFRIPTLTRHVSIDTGNAHNEDEGYYRNIGNEGFLVRGDPYKKGREADLRDYGTKGVDNGVMLVCDTDIESALRLFFTHKGTKTGVTGKGSSPALQVNQTLPIVELPRCTHLGKTIPCMAQTLHNGLCSMHTTMAAGCPAQKALDTISEMEKDDWRSFLPEYVSVGGRGGQTFAYISAETLLEHPLFYERMQQEEQYASA